MTTEPEKQPGHWIVEVFSDGTRHASQFETEEKALFDYEGEQTNEEGHVSQIGKRFHGKAEIWKDGALVKKNY